MSDTFDTEPNIESDSQHPHEQQIEPGDALHDDDLLTDDTEQDETEFTATEEPPAADGQAPQGPGREGMRAEAPGESRFPDIAQLSYEESRDQLVGVVQRLEGGQAPLDETMSLWERGEALADHCSRWLDRAEQRLEQRAAARTD